MAYDRDDNPVQKILNVKTIGTALAGLAALVTVANTVVITGETERGVDYQFGKITSQEGQLRQPGLSLKIPYMQSVQKMRVDQQKADFGNVQTYTRDNQVITASLSILFKTPEGSLLHILRNNPDYKDQMEKIVMDVVKSELGKQDAQNIASNREAIMKNVSIAVAKNVKDLLNIEVIDVQMPNFDFDESFENAVADAANAKAELSKKKTELEQQEVEKAKTIVNAEAAAAKKKLDADAAAYEKEVTYQADAKGRLALAQAEAKGFNEIASSIGRDNMDVYMQTKAWDGKLPTVSGGASTILDARTVAPAIAGPGK